VQTVWVASDQRQPRKYLRSILNIFWISISNILHDTDSFDLIITLRVRRLRLIGNFRRMEDGRLSKDKDVAN